jgi:hypothetical protein
MSACLLDRAEIGQRVGQINVRFDTIGLAPDSLFPQLDGLRGVA